MQDTHMRYYGSQGQKDPLKKAQQPTPILPGESQDRGSLGVYMLVHRVNTGSLKESQIDVTLVLW